MLFGHTTVWQGYIFFTKCNMFSFSVDLSLQFLFTLLKTLDFDNRTNRLGLVFKVVVLMCLPVPVLLWPIVGIVGSLLGGIGYGFFAPLLATFQAVGEGDNVNQKFHHCFIVSVSFCLCNVSFSAPFDHLTLLVDLTFFHDQGSDCFMLVNISFGRRRTILFSFSLKSFLT